MTDGMAWQPSLLDAGEIEPDAQFRTLTRIPLDEESWVDYAPGWLAGSDELFALLLERADWRQRELWMYERKVREPRLTAGWTTGEAGTRLWTQNDVATLREVAGEAVEDLVPGGDRGTQARDVPGPVAGIADVLSHRYGVRFDSVWVNLYRDGRDAVAWHGDRNAKVLRNPLVVTVSLGSRRQFVLRRKGTSTITHRFAPGHGDLVVMGGACQHAWEHSVPRTAKPVGPRMSVTMRHSC
ncbi:MAG: alpha-ketoglutarate-dependent dioxygenase AlkB [Actinomycetota bacterium]|nr:alpha-ketoglutarate-dependent dioxygenase AlkB [Actinomycetota bacterium]